MPEEIKWSEGARKRIRKSGSEAERRQLAVLESRERDEVGATGSSAARVAAAKGKPKPKRTDFPMTPAGTDSYRSSLATWQAANE